MNNLFKSFTNRRVFITGHTGFKGSWLACILNETGAGVLGYSCEPPTSLKHFNSLNLRKKINHTVGDIRDATLLSRTLIDF